LEHDKPAPDSRNSQDTAAYPPAFAPPESNSSGSGSNFYPDDFSPEEFYKPVSGAMQQELQSHILDWPESIKLSNGKADLALELLQMLVSSFASE
ncbi:hypothetical protein G3I27_32570, partial [Streptomyces sp. SID10692]|uniref:hypothetical protein n=1 Tax=Streptomyces sp. SID10692 TaxID=2706026 RepID=UPI0013DAB6D9|nr:hypothetical protein [Streptomyces sp. SID10692]